MFFLYLILLRELNQTFLRNKITKKVYYVEGFELRLICELLPNGTMQWTPDVVQTVQDTYAVLMTGR